VVVGPVVDTVDDVVSTTDVRPVTVTDSDTPATWKATSILVDRAVCTTMVWSVTGLNPPAVAVKVYVPG
jgi:hypothetical protein